MTIAVMDPAELAALIKRAVGEAVEELARPSRELLTAKELGEALGGVSEEMVRYWARETDCPAIRVGAKRYRFRLSDVLRWLEKKDGT
jgi:excisionase family DNA binding protein